MRVNERAARDERGAVLIIFAVFVLVAVVFLAFVIDIGNQRQDRRQLTTATDASALDVAYEWVRAGDYSPGYYPGGDCNLRATLYLDRNRVVDPGDHSCVATYQGAQVGYVSVFAGGDTPYAIAPVFGQDSGRIGSATSVRITPVDGGGLRPFAVCVNDSPELNEWLRWQAGLGPEPVPSFDDIIIGGPKFLSDGCTQNNANWGFVQFASQDNGTPGVTESLEEGSVDPIATVPAAFYENGDTAGDLRDDDADDVADACELTYAAQTPSDFCLFEATGANGWNSNGPMEAFQQLMDDGTVFNLPLYGAAQPDAAGPGSSTGFPIVGFLEVRLLAYCDDPATVKAAAEVAAGACNGGNDNFVHVELLGVATGDCCNINADNAQLEICDVGTIGGGAGSTLAVDCGTGGGSSGGGPPVNPPPDPCEVLSFTPPDQTVVVTNNNGGTLTSDVVVDIEVADTSDCANVVVEADKGNGQTPDATVSLSGSTFRATWPAGTTQFSKDSTFDVVVTADGSAVLDSSPSAGATIETTT